VPESDFFQKAQRIEEGARAAIARLQEDKACIDQLGQRIEAFRNNIEQVDLAWSRRLHRLVIGALGLAVVGAVGTCWLLA
jgi:hypothetical protein